MCETVVAVVFDTAPSPKLQERLVIVPVEVSVKVTVSGFRPATGVPVKLAAGTTAPMPKTEFVLPPSLPVLITTALLKLPALAGVKRMARLVAPKPGKLNGVPDKMVKGPALIVTVPLDSAAPPTFVRTKFAWAFVPTAIVPKLMLAGDTAS